MGWIARMCATAGAWLMLLACGQHAGASAAPPGEPPALRPNILLVILDDAGVDMVAAYAESPVPAKSPVLKALAQQGMLFRNAWATPGCSPTRAMLLTGRYGFRTGVGRAIAYDNSPVEFSVDEFTIADSVGAAGYRTAVVGKWHLGSELLSGPQHAQLCGFEHHSGTAQNLPNGAGVGDYFNWTKIIDAEVVPSARYATTDQVNDALGFISKFGDDPWLIWLAFNASHAPFHKPPPDLHSYVLPELVSEDPPMHARAMFQAMDKEIGRLLDTMDPVVRARTIVIVAGDNGTTKEAVLPPFVATKAKATLYEGGLNVPLIVAGPGIVPGTECNALVSLVDVFATIAELAGSDASQALDSQSLVPYFSDPEQPSMRPWLYAEAFGPNGLLPSYLDDRRAVRDERYKLIVWEQGQQRPLKLEFYDLQTDIWERFPLSLEMLDEPQSQAFGKFLEIMGSMKPWF